MMVNRDKDDNGVIGEGVESKRQNESTDIDMILNEADQQGRYDSSYRVADGIVILEEKWEVNSSEELHSQLLKRCDNTPPLAWMFSFDVMRRKWTKTMFPELHS